MRGRLIFALFAVWSTQTLAQSPPAPSTSEPPLAARPLPLKAPAQPLVVVVARTFADGGLLIEFHERAPDQRSRMVTITEMEQRDGQQVPIQRQVEQAYTVETSQWRSLVLPSDQFRVYQVSGELLARDEVAARFDEPRPVLYFKLGQRLEDSQRQLLRPDALMVIDRREEGGSDAAATTTLANASSKNDAPPTLRDDRAIVFGDQAELRQGDVSLGVVVPVGAHVEVLDRTDSSLLTVWQGKRGWLNQDQAVTYREAFRALSDVLLDRPSVEDYRRRAELIWRNGERRLFSTALEDYTSALRIDPSRAEVYWERASLRCEMGDIDAAQLDYAIAERLDLDHTLPPKATAYSNIARAYSALGQHQTAAIWLEKARTAQR